MKNRFVRITAAILLAAVVYGQDAAPRLTGVEPALGRVGETLTATGEGLGKETVVAIYLSDNDRDYKGTMVEQSEEKIIFTVPEVQPGDYNVSIKVGNNIFIQPVRVKVGG